MNDGLADHRIGVAVAVAKAEGYDRLLAENEKLRTALAEIMTFRPGHFRGLRHEIYIYETARKALEGGAVMAAEGAHER